MYVDFYNKRKHKLFFLFFVFHSDTRMKKKECLRKIKKEGVIIKTKNKKGKN